MWIAFIQDFYSESLSVYLHIIHTVINSSVNIFETGVPFGSYTSQLFIELKLLKIVEI